jgi:hypothetical protein
VLWKTIGSLVLGAVVAVGVANLVIALGRSEPRRPPGAVELVPLDPDTTISTVPEQPDAPGPDGASPDPSVVLPPPVHVGTTPPPSPPPPPPSDDDADDDDDVEDDLDDD